MNENYIDDICESSRSHIVQVHNYLVSSVANPHWFVKYIKSCNAEEFDHRKSVMEICMEKSNYIA